MVDNVRQLAIIRQPHVAIEDHCGKLAIVFEVRVSEGSGASAWILPSDERFASLWEAMKGDVKNLDGKPCWVDASRQGLLIFEEVASL